MQLSFPIAFIVYALFFLLIKEEPKIKTNTVYLNYSTNRKFWIQLCVRNEGNYIDEWLDYHINLGFDNILIVDNNINNTDLEKMKEVAKRPQVRIINKRSSEYKQSVFYRQTYKMYTSNDWILTIDTDEYFTFADSLMTLNRYIALAEYNGCDNIVMNWMLYGNNGHIHKTNGTVIERFPIPTKFTKKVDGYSNHFTKGFARGGIQKGYPSLHSFINGNHTCNGDLSEIKPSLLAQDIITHKTAYVRHYATMSEDEFYNKKVKQWANDTYNDMAPPGDGNRRQLGYMLWIYDTINQFYPNVPFNKSRLGRNK